MAEDLAYKPIEKIPETMYTGGTLLPPKYMPSFYEWLERRGQPIVIRKQTDTAQILYTVPEGKELYITNITLSAVGDVVGARDQIYVYSSSALKILLGLIIKGAALYDNTSMSFPFPYKLDQQETLGLACGAIDLVLVSIIGFLVEKTVIPQLSG